MADKKICVYAICKNESQFIERWLDSMSEADYIVVLDTGSTDRSLAMLRNDKRVTRVERKIIKPWRFDVARNESMKLIPDDADILVCTDFDEIIEPGWAQVLKDNWKDDTTRCIYPFAWSHNSIGEPQDIYKHDKIHTRDYHWHYPVHEVLVKNNPDMEEKIYDAGDSIYFHHLRDASKDRSSYMPLLKLSVEENPEDSHCRMMLAREYLIAGDIEQSLKEYLTCLDYDDFNDPKRLLVKLETYLRIGDCNFILGNHHEALYYYSESLKFCNNHREAYFCMAEVYNDMGLFTLAEASVKAGLKYSVQMFDWTERRDNWIAKADDILAITYFYLGNYDDALFHIKEAFKHNPDDPRIIKNMNYILMSKYEGIHFPVGSVHGE